MIKKSISIKQFGALGLVFTTLLLGGCGSDKTPTKAEQAQIEAQKEQERQTMAEKKILSDFQNKAYRIYTLKQMIELPEALETQIVKLQKENAVKMLLNFELSQRMALQNETNYGAVSSAFASAVKTEKGMVDLVQLKAENPGLKEEIEEIEKGYFGVYKDENGTYRVVNYSLLQKFKPYLTDECSRYIDYMASESSMPAIKNKLVAVEQGELWRRLVYLDNFFTDYPVPSDDLIRNNLGRYYQEILKHALYGDEVAPNFDKVTGVISPVALANFTAQKFDPNSDLYLPFESFKTQLTTDQGLLTPAVSTQIQQLLRLSEAYLTDHID